MWDDKEEKSKTGALEETLEWRIYQSYHQKDDSSDVGMLEDDLRNMFVSR